MSGMKNISKAEVMVLKDQVEYQPGQVVSRTLAQNYGSERHTVFV